MSASVMMHSLSTDYCRTQIVKRVPMLIGFVQSDAATPVVAREAFDALSRQIRRGSDRYVS
jgi:hypothetical protein